jgi:hypothetical protein
MMDSNLIMQDAEQLASRRIEFAKLNERFGMTGIAYRKVVQELNQYQARIRLLIDAQRESQRIQDNKQERLIECLAKDEVFCRMIKLLRKQERRIVKTKARMDILWAEIKKLELIEQVQKQKPRRLSPK